MRKAWLWAALAGAVAWGGTAAAADPPSNGPHKRGDVNVILQGGVGDFTGDLARLTQAGPSWGLVLNLQPWHVLGYELGYDGSRNLVNDERLQTAPAVTRNGGYGLVKLGFPFLEKVRPFAGAGLGASYLSVSDNAEGLYRNDFLEEVPLTAGIEFNTGAVTAGLRASYHWLLDESFADPSAPGNPQGGYMNAALNVGARF